MVVLVFFLAYMFGSIPWGLILVKVFYGIDIRSHGSGNVGATNVIRVTHSKLMGVVVFLLDAGKGGFIVYITKIKFGIDLALVVSVCAILGHAFPVWLKFSGGKGVATWYGTMVTIFPIYTLICGILWVSVTIISGYISVGSILSVIFLPVALYIDGCTMNVTICTVITGCMITFLHRKNIIRLLNKSEPRIY